MKFDKVTKQRTARSDVPLGAGTVNTFWDVYAHEPVANRWHFLGWIDRYLPESADDGKSRVASKFEPFACVDPRYWPDPYGKVPENISLGAFERCAMATDALVRRAMQALGESR